MACDPKYKLAKSQLQNQDRVGTEINREPLPERNRFNSEDISLNRHNPSSDLESASHGTREEIGTLYSTVPDHQTR
jgi:hypothetical protein